MNAFARTTDDCQAGIDAFLDKTDPPWKRGER
jgi:methylglutaconyl-CoA hydratase